MARYPKQARLVMVLLFLNASVLKDGCVPFPGDRDVEDDGGGEGAGEGEEEKIPKI